MARLCNPGDYVDELCLMGQSIVVGRLDAVYLEPQLLEKGLF